MNRIGDSAVLESGIATFFEGQEYTAIIELNKSNSVLEPVVVATPVAEHGNINVHLDTTISFNHSTNKWQFMLHRSIGANNADDTGAEAMTVVWKVIAVRNLRRVGAAVTVADEPH